MTSTTSIRRLAVAALTTTAAVAAVLAAGPGVSSAHDGQHAERGSTAGSTGVGRGHFVAQLRKELRPYEHVSAALADGFVPVGPCAESAAGGMGFHYVAPARFAQPLDVSRPQVLLYGPAKGGGLQLLGAEYLAWDADQDLRTDGDRPVLLGQPFDGPMPGHEPDMPIHYDLHVWTHKANPAGVFAPWNPKVSC